MKQPCRNIVTKHFYQSDNNKICYHTHMGERLNPIIGAISDRGVSVGARLQAWVGFNIRGRESDSGCLGCGGVGGKNVVVAQVSHQLLLPLLNDSRIRLQHVSKVAFYLYLKTGFPIWLVLLDKGHVRCNGKWMQLIKSIRKRWNLGETTINNEFKDFEWKYFWNRLFNN